MLTPKESKTYDYIKDYIVEYGYAPTESEIAKGIGIKSRGVVHRYVHAIAKKGLLKVTPGKRRNISLVGMESSPKTRFGEEWQLPFLGKIAAGSPIEAIEDKQSINIAKTLTGEKCFILEVRGDSMIGDNIFDGDYVICEERHVAPTGSIVVALIDNQEVTLKRYFVNENQSVTLVPSNPQLIPMVYQAERVVIQAVYLGLLRLH